MSSKENENNPFSFKVFEEEAQIDKKIVEKGTVRIIKNVNTEDEKVCVTLKSEEVEVERISINEYVDTLPQVRYEGNTTIVPVVKEVAVVEKRILLVEEIYITKKIITKEEERTIPLMKEDIIIETSRGK
ncbi:MAG: DUF2382 domain-containing protein [Chitinophagaceae bacterium]